MLIHIPYRSQYFVILFSLLIVLARPAKTEPVVDPDMRVAVLVSSLTAPHASTSAETAVMLLEIAFGEAESLNHQKLTLLDRANLDAVLREVEVGIRQRDVPAPSAIRSSFAFLDVQRLVIVQPSSIEGAPRSAISVHVIDTATGLRIATHRLVVTENGDALGTNFTRELLNSIVRPVESLRVIAISPASDARLMAEGGGTGRVLQEAIAGQLSSPKRVLLEMQEARALAREMMIRGNEKLPVDWHPWFLMLRISDIPGERDSFEVRAVLQHRQKAIDDLVLTGAEDELEQIAARIARRFDSLLSEGGALIEQDRAALVADLRFRATQLQATAQNQEALDLVETALLYEPKDTALRAHALEILAELIDRELAVFDMQALKNPRPHFDTIPRVHAWHQRGLEHLDQVLLVLVEMPEISREACPRTVTHYIDRVLYDTNFSVSHHSHYPELRERLFLPVASATDDFKRRALALIDRRRPAIQRMHLSSLLRLYAIVGVGGQHDEESFAVSEARFVSKVLTLNGMGPKRGKGAVHVMFSTDIRESTQMLLVLLESHLQGIKEPWLRFRLDGIRTVVSRRHFFDSPRDSSLIESLSQTWPPGIGFAAPPVEKRQKYIEQVKSDAGFDALPEASPRRLAINELAPFDTASLRLAPCGPWGDLVYTERKVSLLKPDGTLKTLYARDRRQGSHYDIDNASFDGEVVWVMVPAAKTRLLLIDPETGTQREYGEADGIPPSDAGGSVIAFAPGAAIALGTFGKGSNIRTWFARIDRDGERVTVNVFRSAKSASIPAASPDTPGEELYASRVGRLAVSRRPSAPPGDSLRVIAEIERYDSSSRLAAIDPQTLQIRRISPDPTHFMNGVASSWRVLNDGRILGTLGVEYLTSMSPSSDDQRVLRPPMSWEKWARDGESTEPTPAGLFHLLRFDHFPSDADKPYPAMLCFARDERAPVLPVAKLIGVNQMRVLGWSKHQGLLLVDDAFYAIAEQQINQWPRPEYDFQGATQNTFLDHPLRVGAAYRFALIEPYFAEKHPQTLWSLDEAQKMAKDFGTTLPGLKHLDDALLVAPGPRRKRDDRLYTGYWTGLRTSVAEGKVEVDQVLGEDEEGGRPVVLRAGSLEAAGPNDRNAVMLPYARRPKVELTFAVPAVVELPAGTARLGRTAREPGELSARTVTIPPGLWMMEAELSVFHRSALLAPGRVNPPNEGTPRLAWEALNHITTSQVREICQALHELTGEYWRLPTESEWEYACRAGSTTAYASGDDLESLKNMAACEFDRDAPRQTYVIRQREPNAWGLYDMHGGVPELTMYGKRPERFADWLKAGGNFPLELVLRGGGFFEPPQYSTSYARRPYYSTQRLGGLRLVLDRTGQPPTP